VIEGLLARSARKAFEVEDQQAVAFQLDPATVGEIGERLVHRLPSLLVMPVLVYAKQRLAARLGSGATAGEGIQNLPVRGPSRRRASQPGGDRQLGRRLVARSGDRPGDRGLVGVGRRTRLARG
jgi:hypothetical protein